MRPGINATIRALAVTIAGTAMDFIRILRSLEELLYELITWIVLYPRTLWRSAVSPLGMLRYSQREVTDSLEEQYTETLSPVLFLMLTLALSHSVEQALVPHRGELHGLFGRLMSSEQNQLITRSVAFAIFPLIYASLQLRREGQKLDRNTLRRPFFGQCFIAAVFALTLGLSSTMMRLELDRDWIRYLGAAGAVASIAWYVIVQARWLREYHDPGRWSAAGRSVWAFVKATAIVLTAALALSWIS